MGITLIIVGGLVLITAFASGFEYLTKKNSGGGAQAAKRLAALEDKVATLERGLTDRDEEILKLKNEVSFVNRLIGDGGRKEGQ